MIQQIQPLVKTVAAVGDRQGAKKVRYQGDSPQQQQQRNRLRRRFRAAHPRQHRVPTGGRAEITRDRLEGDELSRDAISPDQRNGGRFSASSIRENAQGPCDVCEVSRYVVPTKARHALIKYRWRSRAVAGGAPSQVVCKISPCETAAGFFFFFRLMSGNHQANAE